MSEESGQPESILRNRTLGQILVSLTTGGFAFLISLFATNAVSAVTLSVFIGGLTLVAQFLLNVENRLAKVETAQRQHAARMETLVGAGFSKINEATQLFRLVEQSALRSADVIKLVRHSTEIDPGASPLILRFAQSEIVRMSEFLKEISDGGNVIYEGEDRDWMLSLARNAEQSIDATSLTTVEVGGGGNIDSGLWMSDLGLRYLEVQREAVHRGVRVRRVFIMERSDLAEIAELHAIWRLQKEMGIEVRVLESSRIPGMRLNSIFDFVLFDDAISYEVTPAARIEESMRPTIVNTRLELRQARVRDRMMRFKDLWESASEPSLPGDEASAPSGPPRSSAEDIADAGDRLPR